MSTYEIILVTVPPLNSPIREPTFLQLSCGETLPLRRVRFEIVPSFTEPNKPMFSPPCVIERLEIEWLFPSNLPL